MQIIPAILPKDFEELEDKIESVKSLLDWAPLTGFVQVDVCDGRFVPNFSWPFRKHDKNFEAILREDRGLPAWEDVEYEIDLMVAEPEEAAMQWVTAGASRLVIHVESVKDPKSILSILKNTGELTEVGLAINIDTPNEALAEFADQIKFIQCMGIARIGYQRQPFDPRVLEKIKAIKKLYPGVLISVDGGVSLETAPLLRDAGADRLIVGSAIFGSDANDADPTNVVQTIDRFRNLL